MSRKLLPAGTILNRYRIEAILGEGGFGVTYLAMEPVQQIYVAIKEYFPKSFANRQTGNTIVPNRAIEDQRVFKWGLKRFLEEAKVLARLDHPNIIKVQRYFEMHGTAYLVMEFCDGKPLDKFVADTSGASPRRIFQIYTSLMNALEHVHLHGIIHGDLKPSNILVRTDGTPVLLDFGSARQEMLRLGVGQVSDGYSPPEFYGTSDQIGPWSDIYGLGATFYKLITGVKVPAAIDRSKSDLYIPASNSIADGYSVKFFELIDSSLRMSTSERPQSIAALKRLLPDSGNFSNRYNIGHDLRREVPSLDHSSLSELTWKPAAVVFGILVLITLVITFQNRPAEEILVSESQKVSPILIEEQASVAESQVSIDNSPTNASNRSADFQQALSYLEKVSTSTDISLYSIPQTDFAVRSFRFAMSEIDKKFELAIDRKNYIYYENSREYLFKDFSLWNIKSLEFKATDAKCTYGPIGPVAGTCKKAGRDFKCRMVDLSVKYEHICLSSFSL